MKNNGLTQGLENSLHTKLGYFADLNKLEILFGS